MQTPYHPVTISGRAGKGKYGRCGKPERAHLELQKERSSGHRGPNRSMNKGGRRARGGAGNAERARNWLRVEDKKQYPRSEKDPHTRFKDLDGSVEVATTGKLVAARG